MTVNFGHCPLLQAKRLAGFWGLGLPLSLGGMGKGHNLLHNQKKLGSIPTPPVDGSRSRIQNMHFKHRTTDKAKNLSQ